MVKGTYVAYHYNYNKLRDSSPKLSPYRVRPQTLNNYVTFTLYKLFLKRLILQYYMESSLLSGIYINYYIKDYFSQKQQHLPQEVSFNVIIQVTSCS